MIISMNISHYIKICQVFYTNLSVGVSLILGHGVYCNVSSVCHSVLFDIVALGGSGSYSRCSLMQAGSGVLFKQTLARCHYK